MGHTHIQSLAAVRHEFNAARASLSYSVRTWPEFGVSQEARGLVLPDVRQALFHLEATYLIRLFTQYEAILREHLAQRRRRVPYMTEKLIDRVAAGVRMDARTLAGAHSARQCRNELVHGGEMSELTIPFSDALALLNYYLRWLPEPP